MREKEEDGGGRKGGQVQKGRSKSGGEGNDVGEGQRWNSVEEIKSIECTMQTLLIYITCGVQ